MSASTVVVSIMQEQVSGNTSMFAAVATVVLLSVLSDKKGQANAQILLYYISSLQKCYREHRNIAVRQTFAASVTLRFHRHAQDVKNAFCDCLQNILTVKDLKFHSKDIFLVSVNSWITNVT